MDEKFKKNFLKGSVAAAAGNISGMVFHFISIIYLTRLLSKNDFGLYALILVLVNLYSLIGSLGLNVTIVKFISNNDKDSNRNALKAILNTRIIFLAFLVIVCYFLDDIIYKSFQVSLSDYTVLILILFVLTNFKELFYNVLQGRNEYKKYSIVQVLNALYRFGLIFIAFNFNILTLKNVVIIEIITAVSTLLLQLYFVPLKELLKYKPAMDTYKSIYKFSIPVYFNNILTFTYDRVSILLIGSFLNPLSIALYDVSNKIPEASMRMFSSFMIVYFPNAAKLFSSNDKEGAILLFNKSINFFSAVLSLILLVSILFSHEIITLLFSASYAEVSFAFSLLMINLYLRIISNIIGYSLVSAGFSAIPMKVNLAGSAINIALSVVFLPLYGFIGAVYAILVMNIISQIQYHYYFQKQIAVTGKRYLIPFTLMISFCIISYYLNLSLLFNALLVLVYFFIGWIIIPEYKEYYSKTISLVKNKLHKKPAVFAR